MKNLILSSRGGNVRRVNTGEHVPSLHSFQDAAEELLGTRAAWDFSTAINDEVEALLGEPDGTCGACGRALREGDYRWVTFGRTWRRPGARIALVAFGACGQREVAQRRLADV